MSVVHLIIALLFAVWISPARARADEPIQFGEPIIQWGTQEGETCEDVARAVWGEARYAYLVTRYNGHVSCTPGATLAAGATLVLPAKVTELPAARVTGVHPNVRARPPGGAWGPASAGLPLSTNSNVATESEGRAGIEFADSTQLYLSENTLVVIYGSASRSGVSRTLPAVEIEEGELQTVLSAMRGDAAPAPVEVSIKGGGKVSASSRDTVVQRVGDKTTIGVYDGTAVVANAGKTVDVPKNFGTRFTGQAPPAPPRPLPPAPPWISEDSGFVLAAPDGVVVSGAWDAVPKARAYRVELARDEAFADLVVREEVEASVRTLRFEKFPPGGYYMRVRAIDDEDYLGVASEIRRVDVVTAVFESGAGEIGAALSVAPNSVVALAAGKDVEMAIGDAAFEAVPARLDVGDQRSGARVRLRRAGGAREFVVLIDYQRPVVAPRPVDVPASSDPLSRALESDVGVSAPPFSTSALGPPLWWSPRARASVSIGAVASADFASTSASGGGRLYATGGFDVLGFDLTLRTPTIGEAVDADPGAEVGAHVRVFGGEAGRVALAPGLRVRFPLAAGGQPVRLELGAAMGVEVGRWSLLANIGGRLQLQDDAVGRLAIPGFAILGGAIDATPWLCAYALIDGGVRLETASDDAAEPCDHCARPLGGISLGLEVGTVFFGALSSRLSPFDGPDGGLSGQLSFGVRP